MNQDTQLILKELARLRQDTNQHFEDMQNQMDSRFTDFEAKMDKKLDSRFTDFEAKMDEKLDSRFAVFGTQIDETLDSRFAVFGTQIDETLDSRFAASENLVLEEVDRTRSILESRIDKLDNDVQELKEHTRINNLDTGNITLAIRAIAELQNRVSYLEHHI